MPRNIVEGFFIFSQTPSRDALRLFKAALSVFEAEEQTLATVWPNEVV
jgi:hypothetical protein